MKEFEELGTRDYNRQEMWMGIAEWHDFLRHALAANLRWAAEEADKHVDKGCVGGCSQCMGGDESYLLGIERMKESVIKLADEIEKSV